MTSHETKLKLKKGQISPSEQKKYQTRSVCGHKVEDVA